MKTIIKISGIIIPIILILVACEKLLPDNKTELSDPIKIGALLPYTGSLGEMGANIRKSIELAVEEINDGGGIAGRPIQLVIRDTQTNKKVAIEKAKELLEEGVIAFLGPISSSCANAVVDSVSKPNNILTLSLSDFEQNAQNIVVQATVSYIQQNLVHQKVAVIYIDNEYGHGLADPFIEAMTAAGSEVASSSFAEMNSFDIERYDFFPHVREIMSIQPDIIYIVSYEDEGIKISYDIQDFISTTYNPVLFGCDANGTEGFIKNSAQDVISGMYFVTTIPPISEANYETFSLAYQAKFNEEPNVFTASSYDAIYVMAYAILSLDNLSAITIDQSISPFIALKLADVIQTGQKINVGEFVQAQNLLSTGTDIDYDGASGNLEPGSLESQVAVWSISGEDLVINDNFEEDITQPSVTVSLAAGQDPTSSSVPINFSVVFSEAVTGFATEDVTLGGTAGASTATVTGSGATYNVAVTGMSITGTVTVGVPSGVCTNAAGNVNTASPGASSVNYVYNAPTVDITLATGQEATTGSSPINFAVVFDQPVTGFALDDVIIGGSAGATTAAVAGTGATYNVEIRGMTSQGTVIIDIPANACTNASGIANLASTSNTNVVYYEVVPPTVDITLAAGQDLVTAMSPINFSVVFSEAVTGFVGGSVIINGTSGASIATVTGTGTTYNVAIEGMTNSGSVIIDIPAGACTNASGVGNAASTSTTNYADYVQEEVLCDIVLANGQNYYSNASSIFFEVYFSTEVTGFESADVVVGGTAGATTAIVTGSIDTYMVEVTGMVTDGTVTIDVPAGVCTSILGTPNQASLNTDNIVNYDITPPQATIDLAPGQVTPTDIDPVNFTVTFSEPVIDFLSEDVLNTGDAFVDMFTLYSADPVYTVEASGILFSGFVTIEIPAGVCTDLAGNPNQAATVIANTVEFIGAKK